jgi:hypothetical protein
MAGGSASLSRNTLPKVFTSIVEESIQPLRGPKFWCVRARSSFPSP